MKRIAPLIGLICWADLASAQSTAPLSAIDWLSQSVQDAPARPAAPRPTPNNELPIASDAGTPQVTVTALDAPSPDPVGLLPPQVTGLPQDLWARSDSTTLARLIQSDDATTLPALHDLMMTLLLAQADPPLGSGPDGALFLARVDKLLDLGALDPALALLNQISPDTPELFRRWFDVALLTGEEDDACDVMREVPTVAPTFPARIFCLARNGDWSAAALTLNTHRVLGDITPQEENLISRFLDTDLYEGEPKLPAPTPVTPLTFRMHEAIGEPLSTTRLPNAFAHSDLRPTTGWKSRLEAAERLARIGAISENILHDAYTANRPSASGGVWDRAKAVQNLDRALLAKDTAEIAKTLPPAWTHMQAVKLEVPFARLVYPMLADIPLDGSARDIARKLGLLTAAYETVDGPDDFLGTLAKGTPSAPSGQIETAIHAAFTGAEPDAELESLARNGHLGEAILRSIDVFNEGFAGNTMALTQALAFWRMIGLEGLARQTALQLLILERRI